MTLIITELSEFGIAMVADSAVTYFERLPSEQPVPRVLNGALKLQVIPYLNAGVSVWGHGTLPVENAHVSTDIWLRYFIQHHSGVASLDEFVDRLQIELQNIAGDLQKPLGFHLAGYVDVDDRRLPDFYHVRNNDGTFRQYNMHDFVNGHVPFPDGIEKGKPFRVRNGDYGPYAILSAGLENVLPQIHSDSDLKLAIPHPSLHGRIGYLTAWVRFVSDLYASSGLIRTIGGGITALGISPEGQLVYYPDA